MAIPTAVRRIAVALLIVGYTAGAAYLWTRAYQLKGTDGNKANLTGAASVMTAAELALLANLWLARHARQRTEKEAEQKNRSAVLSLLLEKLSTFEAAENWARGISASAVQASENPSIDSPAKDFVAQAAYAARTAAGESWRAINAPFNAALRVTQKTSTNKPLADFAPILAKTAPAKVDFSDPAWTACRDALEVALYGPKISLGQPASAHA